MRTIYFAHDQQENPESRKHFLESAGYEVRTFKSATELEDALKQGEAPSLVLIDVLIEGKNGFDVTQRITKEMPERTFPIVLCSHVYRPRPFREEALRCGAQDYVLLPVAADELLRRVNQAIGYFVPPGSQKAA
jgi:twitching motility two-component system response regulator PilH